MPEWDATTRKVTRADHGVTGAFRDKSWAVGEPLQNADVSNCSMIPLVFGVHQSPKKADAAVAPERFRARR